MITTELVTLMEFSSPSAGKQREVTWPGLFSWSGVSIVQLGEHMKLATLLELQSLRAL